ncbi:MAG: hypothetical protein ATN35_02590 [Epulopiscium sp. Nele67-Bin004]|nr:MAG: hypothetical protein ATN35_02590 [Epulopiscium sp. Nele67-Bin004]
MYKLMANINKEFDGQWIFMINCQKDDNGKIIGGEVVLNSESRDKVIREMAQYMHEDSETYIRYIGDIPEGISVIL